MHKRALQQQASGGIWKVHAEVQQGDQSKHISTRSFQVWLQARCALKLCLAVSVPPGSSKFHLTRLFRSRWGTHQDCLSVGAVMPRLPAEAPSIPRKGFMPAARERRVLRPHAGPSIALATCRVRATPEQGAWQPKRVP